MSRRESIYVELMYWGLLHIREAAQLQRVDICSIEADHLHNLPRLIKGAKETSHACYLKEDTLLYREKLKAAGGPVDSSLLQKYQDLWNLLEGIGDSAEDK